MNLHHHVGVLRRAAAKHRLDAREELARGERLDEVVVGARLEPGDLVGLAAAAGEEDDRHRDRAPLGAQLPREGKPGRVREHPVEEDQLRERRAHQGFGLADRARPEHPVARVLQVQGEDFLQLGIVFDDENRVVHGAVPFHSGEFVGTIVGGSAFVTKSGMK
jgi:hypothetical protein